MGQGVTGQETQSHCVQCGKQGNDSAPLNRCEACKTSRYCSKECQAKHRIVHKTVCMAIQELEKRKATEDANEHDVSLPLNAKTAGWPDKTCGTEVHSEMHNSGEGSRGIVGYGLPGLCSVKEMATNSPSLRGIKEC